MKEDSKIPLRCRPGDLARIKSSWNSLLVGRTALVRKPYSESEWVISIVGDPALVPSEDGSRIIAARLIIADDWALEPLARVFCNNRESWLTYLSAPTPLRLPEEAAEYI